VIRFQRLIHLVNDRPVREGNPPVACTYFLSAPGLTLVDRAGDSKREDPPAHMGLLSRIGLDALGLAAMERSARRPSDSSHMFFPCCGFTGLSYHPLCSRPMMLKAQGTSQGPLRPQATNASRADPPFQLAFVLLRPGLYPIMGR
jgi:hypothetical protein